MNFKNYRVKISILLALVFVISLSSCGKKQEKPLEPEDQKQALQQFKIVQSMELRTMNERHRNELREFQDEENKRRNEWERAHKSTEGLSPAEIEKFRMDEKGSHEVFKRARSARQKELKSELKELKEKQKRDLKDFKKSVDDGKLPPQKLWPKLEKAK